MLRQRQLRRQTTQQNRSKPPPPVQTIHMPWCTALGYQRPDEETGDQPSPPVPYKQPDLPTGNATVGQFDSIGEEIQHVFHFRTLTGRRTITAEDV